MARTWLLTGAASGIGRQLGLELARRGERLVLWDRDASGLEQTRARVEGACVHIEAVDVVDADAVSVAARRSFEAASGITRAVHCAGILRTGPSLSMAARDYRAMIDVNYLGTVHVTQALFPLLEGAASPTEKAQLALVSSIAGLRAMPLLAGYSASKHAVVAFAEALRDEMYDSAVDLRVICPPAVDTPMVRNLAELPPIYRLSPPQPVEKIAVGILRSLERREFVSLLDVPTRALRVLQRTLPSGLDWVIRRAGRSP